MRTPEPTPAVARELAALDDALAGRAVDPDLRELAELAIAIRDERPRPRPDWTRELDAKIAAGPAPAAPRVRSALARLRPPLLPALGFAATVALVVVVALAPGGDQQDGAGGGGGSSAAQSTAASGGAGEAASDEALQRQSAGSAADSAGSTASPALAAPSGSPRSDSRRDRKVERSAALTLAAAPDRVDAVADGIVRVTDALGGFVATSTVGSRSGGTFELRVPASRLQQALAELSKLAHVRSRTQSTQDITASYVSARDRLADARAERRSLLQRLENATTANETSALRARLRIVSRQISAARADLARVNNRANYATVSVSLVATRGAAAGGDDDGGWTPGEALEDAVQILEFAAGIALVALALALPIGLVAGLAFVATRQAARRRRERALDAI